MACYHPSKVNVQRKLRKDRALSPGDQVPRPDASQEARRADAVTVPCGHCLGCRTDQAREWAIRLMHESQMSPASWFLTLTYDDEHLPENGSLSTDDPPRFVERLRKVYRGDRISYFICGEYGEQTGRPHYHAVLYGPEFLDRVVHTRRHGAPVWQSETIGRVWPYGIHEFTGVTYEAAAYVAGYVRKKVRQRDDPDYYVRVDPDTGEVVELQQEFARMSRRPALGRTWLERYWTDAYPRDFVIMNGHPFKPPRYYDKWMEENQPEIMEEVRYQRWKDQEEIGDEVLIMKEKVHRARINLFAGRDAV